MSGLWWGLGVAGLAWLGIHHWLDRASVPAWQAKRAYRLLTPVLLVLLVLAVVKACQYRLELRYVIRTCR